MLNRRRFSEYGFMRGNGFILNDVPQDKQAELKKKFDQLTKDFVCETDRERKLAYQRRKKRRAVLPEIVPRPGQKQQPRVSLLQSLGIVSSYQERKIEQETKRVATLMEHIAVIEEERIEEKQDEDCREDSTDLKEMLKGLARTKPRRLMAPTHEMHKLFTGQPLQRPRKRELGLLFPA